MARLESSSGDVSPRGIGGLDLIDKHQMEGQGRCRHARGALRKKLYEDSES